MNIDEMLESIKIDEIKDPKAKANAEKLKIRLLEAKNIVDVYWAWLAYSAAEVDRLNIKLSVIKEGVVE